MITLSNAPTIKDDTISLIDLTLYASDFLRKNYNTDLTIPIKCNNRLSRSMGRYIYSYNQPKRIEIAGHVFDYATNIIILKVLRHELIHYALHKQGLPFDDGDYLFEKELIKHNAPRTESFSVGKKYLYKCNNCNRERATKTKKVYSNPHLYKTGCCNDKLTILGHIISNGEETKRYYIDN